MIASYKNVTVHSRLSVMWNQCKEPVLQRALYPPPRTDIAAHREVCYVQDFGNASSSYEGHVFGTLRLLLRFVAHAVVCRIARFGGQRPADCPASWSCFVRVITQSFALTYIS
jgi:hypothetical protein